MEAAPPTPYLTEVTTTADPPAGVTPRTDALLRLGQAALELAGGGNHSVELTIHGVTRQAFDAFPDEPRDGDSYSAKTITLDGLGLVTLTLFTTQPPADTAPDWFEIAKRITGTRP